MDHSFQVSNITEVISGIENADLEFDLNLEKIWSWS